MSRQASKRDPQWTDPRVLDGLRGLAALYVMLGHARWLLWSGYHEHLMSQGPGLGRTLALASAVLRDGRPAVLFFFLMSGFCIHYRQAQKLATDSDQPRTVGSLLDVRRFAWRRFRRLFPPLVVAVALTLICDSLGAWLNPDFYRGASPYESINVTLLRSSYSPEAFVGTLLFQANLAVPVFGSDGPLWSLSYEFWFYVLYPVLLTLELRFQPWRMLGIIGLISAAGLLASHATPSWVLRIFTYWIVWASGAAIAEAHVRRIRPRCPGVLLLVLGSILIGPELVASPPQMPQLANDQEVARDLLCAAGMGLLLAWLMLSPHGRVHSLVEATSRRVRPLSTISYSLYLVHFPWLTLLSAWWLASHERLPLGVELVVPGAISAMVLATAYWHVVERHFVSNRRVRPSIRLGWTVGIPLSD